MATARTGLTPRARLGAGIGVAVVASLLIVLALGFGSASQPEVLQEAHSPRQMISDGATEEPIDRTTTDQSHEATSPPQDKHAATSPQLEVVTNNAQLNRLIIEGVALDEPDYSPFSFGPIPSHARRYGRNTATSRNTGAPCICTSGSCFTGAHFLACAKKFTVADERHSDELAEVLVNRTRRVVEWWKRRHGGIPAHKVAATLYSRSVIVFFAPPNATLIVSPHSTHRPLRVRFLAEDWARIASLPNVVAWYKKRFPGREGFLLVSDYDDFADENLPYFSTYSLNEATMGAKHFLMFDRSVTMLRTLPTMENHVSTRYDAFAQVLYGRNISYLPPPEPWMTSHRFASWHVKPDATRSPDDDLWQGGIRDPLSEVEIAHSAGAERDMAQAVDVPWSQREKKLYFRGTQTRAIRGYFREAVLSARNVTDVAIAKTKKRNDPSYQQFVTRILNYRLNLAIRGQNAALRDRMLLLSGSALVRVVSLEWEPCLIHHHLLHPWVHFVPFAYYGNYQTRPRYAVQHFDNMSDVLSSMLLHGDEPLRIMAANVKRLGKLYASRLWRDHIMAESIALYADALVGDGHPTTLSEARAFVNRYAIPKKN